MKIFTTHIIKCFLLLFIIENNKSLARYRALGLGAPFVPINSCLFPCLSGSRHECCPEPREPCDCCHCPSQTTQGIPLQSVWTPVSTPTVRPKPSDCELFEKYICPLNTRRDCCNPMPSCGCCQCERPSWCFCPYYASGAPCCAGPHLNSECKCCVYNQTCGNTAWTDSGPGFEKPEMAKDINEYLLNDEYY